MSRSRQIEPLPSTREVEQVRAAYRRLNREKFGSLLRRLGGGVDLDVRTDREISDDTGILLAEWRPRGPVTGRGGKRFERRGMGRIVLHGHAGLRELLHEMVHAAQSQTGLEDGHGPYFARIAREVGLPLDRDVRAASLAESGAYSAASVVACYRFR